MDTNQARAESLAVFFILGMLAESDTPEVQTAVENAVNTAWDAGYEVPAPLWDYLANDQMVVSVLK